MDAVVEVLKGSLNKEIRIKMHFELRDDQLGNMWPPTKPQEKDEEMVVRFIGLYGFRGNPLYILGEKDGKEFLFKRGSREIFSNEESGIPTHDRKGCITSVNDVPLDWRVFSISSSALEEHFLESQAGITEEQAWRWAADLLRGIPKFNPRSYNFDSVLIDEVEFIDLVKKCLDRII